MLPSVPQELMDAADRRGNSAYGSAYAFYSAALSFGMMAGPVASGMLAGYPGLGTALILAAIGLLTYALLLRNRRRPERRENTHCSERFAAMIFYFPGVAGMKHG